MINKKKKLQGGLLCLIFLSLLPGANYAQSELPFSDDAFWKWSAEPGEHLMYHIVDNIIGERYEAFNVSGSPWDTYGLDALNITRFKYNVSENAVEETPAIMQCAVSTSPGFWQLSFYDENSNPEGEFIFAFPLIPVVTENGALDLNSWGAAMTSNIDGTSYARALNLFEYNVNGNELQVYNSTNGNYVNMTYNSSGYLQIAEISVDIDMGGPVNVMQTMTAITPDLSLLNPIDETQLAVEVDDLLIYEQKMGMMSGFAGYNITYVGPIIEDGPGGSQVYIGANATLYHWIQYDGTWEIDTDEGDPPSYNFSIGGGNDLGQILGMDGPFNIVYPEGTNGTDLYDYYYPLYSQPQYGGLDIALIAEWSLQLSNSSGDFIRIELNGSTGILKNGSYSSMGMEFSFILSKVADLPLPIESDLVQWNTNEGVIQYYEVNRYNGTDVDHYYERAVVNNIYHDIVDVDMYGSMIPLNVSIVNATKYRLSPNSSIWMEVPMDFEASTYEYENIWGMGNNEGPVHIGGETARIYQDGTNGYTLENMFTPIGQYYGMDYYLSSSVLFEMNNGSFSGNDIYLQIDIDPATGWITHQSLRIPNEEPGPEEPDFNQIERWLIAESALPYNNPPVVIATPGSDNNYDPSTAITVTISDNTGIASVDYRWDSNSNTTVSGTFETSLPVPSGVHTLEFWVEDLDGNLVHDVLTYTTNNYPPVVIASPEPDSSYEPSTDITVTISDNSGIASVDYRWDSNSNTTVSGTFVTSLPVAVGPHILEIWVEDIDGNLVHDVLTYNTVINPPVVIVTPGSDNNYDPSTVITVTISDNTGIANVDYRWDSNSNTTVSGTFVTSLPIASGVHTLEFWVEDLDGNIVHDVLTYTTNNYPPVIIESPDSDNSYDPSTAITVTISDNTGIASVDYRWDSNSNTTASGTFVTSLPIASGVHTLEFWVEDLDGNIVHDILTYTTNNYPPVIDESPDSDNSYDSGTEITITISDNTGIANVEYRWDSNSNTTTTGNFVTSLPSIAGEHTLEVWVEDIDGNIVHESFTFITNEEPGTTTSGTTSTDDSEDGLGIPGFALELMGLCFITSIASIIIKKRKKILKI